MSTVTFTSGTVTSGTAHPGTMVTAASRPPRAPRLRLTSRGRAVLTTLAAAPLVALAVFLGLGDGDAVASHSAPDASLEYVSVAPGQSLWQLAQQVAPEADPREVVADILSLNRLVSADVQPGQELAIPAHYGS